MAPNTQQTTDTNGNSQNGTGSSSKSPSSANAELAQALRDLARGEQAANSLEADLARFEDKLDAMLASFEADPTRPDGDAGGKPDSEQNDRLHKRG